MTVPRSKRKNKLRRQPSAPARSVLNQAPLGSERRRVLWFIALFLVANMLIPLRWYAGLAEDERFSWRMFSSNSLQRTRIRLWETVLVDGEPVERRLSMPTIVQPAWSDFLFKYHQPELVRKLLANHCRQTNAISVRFLRTGIWSDGSPVEPYALTLNCSEP